MPLLAREEEEGTADERLVPPRVCGGACLVLRCWRRRRRSSP